MTALAIRLKGVDMTSIKNAEALHALGKERFYYIEDIANSPNAYVMRDVMWTIVDETPENNEQSVIYQEIMHFLDVHDQARRK